MIVPNIKKGVVRFYAREAAKFGDVYASGKLKRRFAESRKFDGTDVVRSIRFNRDRCNDKR